MPNLESLTTFSGLVVALAAVVVFYRLYTVAAVMLIMDGAGGTAIFWDRWSQRAGHQVLTPLHRLYRHLDPRLRCW
jgi:hypothetical protein